MKLHRIQGILLRQFYIFRRSLDKMADAFYWPVIDLILWGLTARYFDTVIGGGSSMVFAIVSGIIFWLIVWRAQYEITVGVLDELWTKNMINLFGTPLQFKEWFSGLMLLSLGKSFVTFTFALFLAMVFYKANLLSYGWYLLPFLLLLFMTAWWMAFLVSGVILRYGTKVQALCWTTIFIIAPFAAIYYPVSILPGWAQPISYLLPITYVFENGRSWASSGVVDISSLLKGFGLNILYLVLSLWYLKNSLTAILKKGLMKVH